MSKKSYNNFSSSRIMTEKIFRKTRLVTKFMKKNFIALAEISEVFALAKKQLTQQVLHPLSQSDWLNLTDNFSDATWIQKTQQKISQYLGIEGEKIPQNQAFLATSDIIEKVA